MDEFQLLREREFKYYQRNNDNSYSSTFIQKANKLSNVLTFLAHVDH
uniref:Uncharacterized protein n=1 Tax=Tetranychus urticae TaxID=32264 RepID=T1JV33_TETUR